MTNLWRKTTHPVDGCFELLITSVFTTFISTPLHLPVSISPKIRPYSTVSSPPPTTKSSANFSARIICPVSKSPDASTDFFLKQSLYQWIASEGQVTIFMNYIYRPNTLRTGLLNCLNARSRGLTFRHRASCI